MTPTVTAVVDVMPSGDGFPSLVGTDDGRRFVMKLSGTGQGAGGLAREFVAARVARSFGLRVPDVLPIALPKTLPWQAGTDEFYEALQRSSGLNLGVSYIEGARNVAADALGALPEAFLDRLAAVDGFLQNVDRTAKNPNLLDDRGEIWAIDFGACLFIDRMRGGGARFDLPGNHFLAGRRGEMLPVANARSRIADIVGAIPEPWIEAMRLRRGELSQTLNAIFDLYPQRG